MRSYLIHRFGPLGADAAAIVKRLDEEPDLTIRRALILSLGEFGEKEWLAGDRKAVTEKLQDIYRTAADPGLHAAAEWLLRRWKQNGVAETGERGVGEGQEQREKRLAEIKQTLAKDKEKRLAAVVSSTVKVRRWW